MSLTNYHKQSADMSTNVTTSKRSWSYSANNGKRTFIYSLHSLRHVSCLRQGGYVIVVVCLSVC